MDITLLKQKITEWNKACEYFARPDIKKLLADEEKTAIEFLCDFWKSSEYNPGVCEKFIEILKQCDKLHSSNREIIEKSKTFRGIAQTFYTKNATDFDQFRKELGWSPTRKETPTPKNTPTPTPSPTPQHNDALMMINIEKWSKAMQFLRSEIITPQLETNELTAIELLDNMWRRPVYKPDMKEEAAEMVKVLIDSHKLHSSNREIIEHSKNLCGVARKVYENKEIFEAFKKAISQYYKDNQPKRVPTTPIPEKKEKEKKKPEPPPIRKDSELILSDVVFANTDYKGNVIKDYGKTLFNDTLYITSRLIVASEYYGTETIFVKLRYPDGSTSEYDDEITFKGKGNYGIAGWGSNSGTLYADHSYVEYTFICRGKKLWQGRVNITQDPSKAQYPNIIDIKFGATDHDGDIVVKHGSPIPTGIPYLSPMIVVDNNFQGSITLDIEYRFETRNTNKTSSTVNIRGRGEYQLSGWGRSDCGFYTEPETITCTISYKGKKLYSKTVKIGKGSGSGRKKTPVSRNYNTSSGSLWQRFKNKIEDIGEWFDDKTDNPESVTSIISAIIFIIYVIGIVVYWINEGFIAALIFGVIGFFVTGLAIMAINFVTKILLYILRFVFLNVWTFLIAAILLLIKFIFPVIMLAISNFATLGDSTEQIEPKPETITYYCTAERGVNVRIAPSTSASQVGALTYKQQVEVYEIEGDFARIDYNGDIAYVSSKYICIDNDDFFAENAQRKGIKSMNNGIQYEIIKKGKGNKPQADDIVKCNYEVSLLDGTVFDSSTECQFELEKVIKGISISFQDMKVGEKRRVYIPPQLAYGEKGVINVIPANSALIFNIELLEIIEKQEIAHQELLFTDFTVKQDDGTEASLSDYVGRGRYVLVDFWASWCAPCRKSLPNLINFYRGHNRAVDMLGVTIQDKPEDSRAIIYQYDIEYPQILNADWSHAKLYGIEGIPHLILFDPEGRKIMEGYPDEDFLMEVKSIIYRN